MDNNSIKEFFNAIGVMAEISLNFYRMVLNAGATDKEAATLTQAYISASLYGRNEENNDGK